MGYRADDFVAQMPVSQGQGSGVRVRRANTGKT
jgi:hypothetical protein